MFNFTKDYFGDEVRFFIGVVEEESTDPLGLGRVRVRCFGLHSPFTSDIPFDQLPWAHVALPTTESGVNGIGRSSKALQAGSFVFGVFLDGTQSQTPLVLGIIPKQETVPKMYNAMRVSPASSDNRTQTLRRISEQFNVPLDEYGQPSLKGELIVERAINYFMTQGGLPLQLAIGIAAALFYGTAGQEF